MTEQPKVVDELERRLLASYYPADSSASASARTWWRPRRTWVSAGSFAAAAVLVAVVVILLVNGGVNPSTAQAALTRAADAAGRGSEPVLSGASVWKAVVLQTSEVPGQSSNSSVTLVATHTVRIARDGTVTERTVTAQKPRQSDGVPTVTASFVGHGKLASPLVPTQPLLSYRALSTLPDQVAPLRRVIAGIQAELFPQRTTTTTSSSTSTDSTSSGNGVDGVKVVGICCGSGATAVAAVGKLSIIAWLLALPVRPSVRAALYRTAATLPGVRYDGTARDSLGRQGGEVSVGSGSDELKMIFDENTGALLAISYGFGSSALKQGYGPLTYTLKSAGVSRGR